MKIRGFTVEATEVEVALRALEGVRDCAVVPRGEPGDAMLVAFVLARPDAALSESGCAERCGESCPSTWFRRASSSSTNFP